MPNIDKEFFKKLTGTQTLPMRYVYTNGAIPSVFLRDETDNLATEESPEKALMSAIVIGQYLRANRDDPSDQLLKDIPDEDLNLYNDIVKKIVRKSMTDKQYNAILDAMDKKLLNDLESVGEDGTVTISQEAQKRMAEEEADLAKIAAEKREAEQKKAEERTQLEQKARENADKKYKDVYDKAKKAYEAQDEKEDLEKPNELLIDGDFLKRFQPYEIAHKFDDKAYFSESQKIPAAQLAAQIRQENDEKNANSVNFFNDRQRTIAESRFSCYFGLKHRIEKQTFLDILKHPIDAIKERIQLRGAKNDIQKNYGLNDAAMDKMYDLVMNTPVNIESNMPGDDQPRIPDSFGFIKKDGTVERKTAPEEEYQKELQKLEKEFANNKENEKIVKEMKDLGYAPETQEEFAKKNAEIFNNDPNISVKEPSQNTKAPSYHNDLSI